MTFYDAWARGHRWVLYRGFLCRVSRAGRRGFWVSHLGNWRGVGHLFHKVIDAGDPGPVEPVPTHTPRFNRLRHRPKENRYAESHPPRPGSRR